MAFLTTAVLPVIVWNLLTELYPPLGGGAGLGALGGGAALAGWGPGGIVSPVAGPLLTCGPPRPLQAVGPLPV